MQAVILAAGESSRFYPYNLVHKSLIKIMGESIIEHTLKSIKESGINEVIIVVKDYDEFKNLIGNGESFGLKIKYVNQSKPHGMGDALLSAQTYIHDNFFLLNASHVDFIEFKSLLEEKKDINCSAVVLGKKELSQGKYGVYKINKDKVIDLVEKPLEEIEQPNVRIIGIYLLNKKFLEILKKTPVNHYSFEDALSVFVKTNTVNVVVTDKKAVSLKYPWDILDLKNYLMRNLKRSISPNAEVSKSAEVSGNVVIEEGVKILEGTYLKGPCFIGKNVFIGNNSLLRSGVDIEKDSKIGAYMEIKNSLIMEKTSTHSGFIGDSVIGKECKIGGQFNTANIKINRMDIDCIVKNEKINTKKRSIGVFIGNNSKIGIRVSTMPGVIIGNNTVIGPSTTVFSNVGDYVKYYTKFKENIIKLNQLDNNKSLKSNLRQDSSVRSKLVLFDIDYTLFNTREFKDSGLLKYSLYEEVTDLLTELGRDVVLGIISEGDTIFQKNKLLETGIMKYFTAEHVHIVEKKDKSLKEILEKYKDDTLYLVDDKLSILYTAKKIMPSIITIWIKRGIYADNQKPIYDFIPDATINKLGEIIKIIQYEKKE